MTARLPPEQPGFAVLFTGIPGAGKSTLATALAAVLRDRTGRGVTVIDGDAVRGQLSSDLGFSREDREINLRRIGFVAAAVVKRGGIALCAVIAPYAASRRELRVTVEAYGGFAEVHVSTPLAVCEERDPKGLYAKARAGLIEGLTGLDGPYEAPVHPDLRIDTVGIAPDAVAQCVLASLERLDMVPPNVGPDSRPHRWPVASGNPSIWGKGVQSGR